MLDWLFGTNNVSSTSSQVSYYKVNAKEWESLTKNILTLTTEMSKLQGKCEALGFDNINDLIEDYKQLKEKK